MEQYFTDSQLLYLALITITAPFLSFLFGQFFKKYAVLWGISSISISLVTSVLLFFSVWQNQVLHYSFSWIKLANIQINLGFLLNNLSVIMLVLVSFIALLVHIYSVEYIRKDALKYRYFSYLSLFCFAMLCVVMADNLFLLYAFWELVGFASYLLIGFWFTKRRAVHANKKAFVMNRVGDVGFLVGIMILLAQFGTVDLQTLFAENGLIHSSFVQNGLWVSPFRSMPSAWLTIAGVCFLLGAAGKSAQFPLHSWLPDAMQGPTAVSSLIHAATMVAAGVFLLLRISPLFNEAVLTLMASIGLLTAFMAASIALTQTDIKKVLAFSTISQLGFMVLAVGVQDNASAIFHLSTHAFFKCLLFLAAGMVIHQLHHVKEYTETKFDEQDMANMGGLFKRMPLTAVVFIIAALALAGLPFTSGFLSKDGILISVFDWAGHRGGLFWIFPLLVSITSWLTTFYIFRLIFKTFFGDFRLPNIINVRAEEMHLHDPNNWMKVPAVILAVCCLGLVFAINPLSLESSWLHHAFVQQAHENGLLHLLVPVYINVLSVVLIIAAYYIYAQGRITFSNQRTWYYQFSYQQWYFNWLYDKKLVALVLWKSKMAFWFDRYVIDGLVHFSAKAALFMSRLSDFCDRYLVDGAVNGIASIMSRFSVWFRSMQNGKLQHYFVWMLLLFLGFMIFKIII
ncbi:NADH dehydrogenase [Pelobium manganitolerans]|uniref:NADH dehydrogenase n=1 Tax=Pelobium manganitolerans TaxID=1842495 RepID=A0A419S8N4_9SPHI|nr:NADH-quinone oxidoreductase subunit L [Pelobium manganitolerans]RKD18287.1 NADH dehydrogenase [Pelobium manganitolerans]